MKYTCRKKFQVYGMDYVYIYVLNKVHDII